MLGTGQCVKQLLLRHRSHEAVVPVRLHPWLVDEHRGRGVREGGAPSSAGTAKTSLKWSTMTASSSSAVEVRWPWGSTTEWSWDGNASLCSMRCTSAAGLASSGGRCSRTIRLCSRRMAQRVAVSSCCVSCNYACGSPPYHASLRHCSWYCCMQDRYCRCHAGQRVRQSPGTKPAASAEWTMAHARRSRLVRARRWG